MQSDVLITTPVEDILLITISQEKLYQDLVDVFQCDMMKLVNTGHRYMVMDLTNVKLINSSGLGVMILVSDILEKCGGKMVVMGLGPLMSDLFERMQLDRVFPIFEDRESALKSFKNI